MEPTTIFETIPRLLEAKKLTELKSYLRICEPIDIAEGLLELWDNGEIKEDSLAIIFRVLPKELAAQVFTELDSDLTEVLTMVRHGKGLRKRVK